MTPLPRRVSSHLFMAFVTALYAALYSASVLASPPALRFECDPGKSQIEFTAIGRPSALKIVGKGTGAQGGVTELGGKTSGEVSFDLTTLKTGIDMRDRHMKEKYLETGKFPRATLKIMTLALPSESTNAAFTAENLPFTGKLLLHGVEKPISGTTRVSRSGATAQAQAIFKIKLTDYGVEIPKFAGITVAEDVDVHVDLEGKITPVGSTK